MIEKRRRDRINNSLTELRRLVPQAFEKQVSDFRCCYFLILLLNNATTHVCTQSLLNEPQSCRQRQQQVHMMMIVRERC